MSENNYSARPAVGIAGVTGYAGRELLRLLRRHPGVRLTRLYARSGVGTTAGALEPVPGMHEGPAIEPLEQLVATDVDLLFLALPHGEAARLVPALPARLRIVDLSGDFRLRDAAAYPRHYRFDHPAPQMLADAVYGLPELSREQIATARLVANPGCYPTAALLALAPLAAAGVLPATVAVHAFSGVSGAGRTPNETTHFVAVNESVVAYKVGVHQHTPEMEQGLAALGAATRVAFLPHLLPVTRGIHVTVTMPGVNSYTTAALRERYAEFYGAAPFVRVLDAPPHMGETAYTNRCDLFVHVDERAGATSILAAIDNLGKGAAGQAVQNMNLMLGLSEITGLQ